MASNPITRWADRVGIDIRSKKRWEISAQLLTTGKLPTGTLPAGNVTHFYFQINVEPDAWMWCVGAAHEAEDYAYSRFHNGTSSTSRTTLAVPSTPKLASLGRWLRELESLHAIEFRRDRPLVWSSVKGGKKATEAWLLAL